MMEINKIPKKLKIRHCRSCVFCLRLCFAVLIGHQDKKNIGECQKMRKEIDITKPACEEYITAYE